MPSAQPSKATEPGPDRGRPPGQIKFTLVDFRKTMGQLRKLGPLQRIMSWIPGMRQIAEMMRNEQIDPEQDLKQIEGIIDSMTPQERENPELIDTSRRRRIAVGSGTEPVEINKLIREFSQMAGLMQSMAGMSKMQQMRQIRQLADGGLFSPSAILQPWKYRRPGAGA
jgi:signal recognition particle subunit SRP54